MDLNQVTNAIHNATTNSLVIWDEFGKGARLKTTSPNNPNNHSSAAVHSRIHFGGCFGPLEDLDGGTYLCSPNTQGMKHSIVGIVSR